MPPKRRERRRRKRRGRKERPPEERVSAPGSREEASEAESQGEGAVSGEGVSWTGVAGAVMGVVPLTALAGIVLVDPGDAERTWALLFALPAAGFVPALWVSITESANRQRIQRATVIGSLLLVFVSTFLVGLILAFVLMPATALLAIAAGLIFQGSGVRK